VKVFKDAANRTCAATFRLDTRVYYPLTGMAWAPIAPRSKEIVGEQRHATQLSPDEDGSPIVLVKPDEAHKLSLVGPSDYRARGGVNTGGANTILWVQVLKEHDGTLLIRNVGKTMRSKSIVREAEVEKAFVHPMLRGTDVRRWRAEPSGSLLLCYDESTPKQALPEATVAQRAPKTLAFLKTFETELRARKEYIRWGAKGPFYEVYRIGPYTFAQHRVVWQHTGFQGQMRCAVVSDQLPKAIPDQKVILVAADSSEEAHYICAVVNSEPVGWVLRTYLGTDASTHILDFAGVAQFDAGNATHVRLSTLSQEAHRLVASGEDVSAVESEIDAAVSSLATQERAAQA